MRPACAYPPVLQTSISNGPGPDLYRDRDTFTYGVATGQTLSVQPAPQTQGIYHVSAAPNTGLGCSNTSINPQIHSQHPSFALQHYPHIQLQQAYTPVPGDLMSTNQLNPNFSSQQQQYTSIPNPCTDKLIVQNIPPSKSTTISYTRSSNSNSNINNCHTNTNLQQSQMIPNSSVSNYTMISAPNTCPIVSGHQRLPNAPIGQNPVNSRTIPQQLSNRSVGSRIGTSEPLTYQTSPFYVSYTSDSTLSQSGGAPSVPYSMSISNANPTHINSSVPQSSVYCPSQSLPQQPVNARPILTNRVQNSSTVTMGSVPTSHQQPSIYVSQSTRLVSPSTAYSSTAYINQPYVTPSPTFRPSPNSINAQSMPTLPRSTTTPSHMSRDGSGTPCLNMHPVLAQQQHHPTQLPCSSSSSTCSSTSSGMLGMGISNGPVGPGSRTPISMGPLFNQSIQNCNVSTISAPNQTMTPNPGTPPCGIQMGSSQALATHVGQINGEMKLNSEGCFLPNRPVSSGNRDSGLSLSVGSVGDMVLSSSAFHVSGPMSVSTTMPFSNTQQIPGISGDFDNLVPNNSPLMMMAMPTSSPMPAAGLINTPLPTGMVNVAMPSTAPAPPPYHQPTSMTGCRTLCPSFYGPNSMTMAPLTVTTTIHVNSAPTMTPMTDSMVDRHSVNLVGDNTAVSTGTKQSAVSGKATRPKRVRANKASTGVGRGSRANSKKNVSANAIQSAPGTESFPPNQRTHCQTSKQKVTNWNTNVGPPGIGSFSPNMMSPTQSMCMPLPNSGCPSTTDSRGSMSPVSFTSPPSSSGMRPNSGPPGNLGLAPVSSSGNAVGFSYSQPQSSVDPNGPAGRLPVSPRNLYATGPVMSHQQYSNLTSQNGSFCSNHNSGVMPNCSNTSGNAFFNQSNTIPNSSMNFQQHASQSCYSTNGPPVAPRSHSSNQFHSLSPQQPQSSGSIASPIQVRGLPQSGTAVQNPYHPDSSTYNRASNSYPNSGQNNVSPMDPPPTSSTDTDRLVCPITNGMVWGPTQIQLMDVLNQYLPEGVYIRRFEFDLTANHLNTIVGRSDLDIVVCSHLLAEPLQVCHWPPDVVQIRFNDYLLRLDRSSVNGGQPAHKVACVKHLCRPGRNQLEIAIIGLGEDPTQPMVLAKRRATAATLEAHRFAAFMAHMPALNVLLDGLQRRRPAGVNTLCDILEGRVGMRNAGDDSNSPNNQIPQTPVVAELSLICPVFRTRMRIPGRIAGCQHVEAFDMEAFLRREVFWPRLHCPICGHKSPAGLDGLCIDTTILNALHLVHPSVNNILVRSDGFWRLTPPMCLDIPPDIDQWQPMIGPLTELVTQAFSGFCSKNPNRTASHGKAVFQNCGMPLPNTSSQLESNTSYGQRIPSNANRSASIESSFKPQVQTGAGHSSRTGTPCPDSITSPSWTVKSNSPICTANQDNMNLSSSNADPSRPASQPVSWNGMQPSPYSMEKRCAKTPQYGNSPCLVTDNSNSNNYPPNDLFNVKSSASPSRPSSTGGSVILRTASNKGSNLNDGDMYESAPKVRRDSSTGSFCGTRNISPADASSKEVHSRLDCNLNDDEKSSKQGSWSQTSVEAPIVSSPSSTSRTVSSSFSIPAIPGVNMNVVESVTSTTSLHGPPLTITSINCGSVKSSTLLSRDCESEISAVDSDGGSPSPHLGPITAAASAFMLGNDEFQATIVDSGCSTEMSDQRSAEDDMQNQSTNSHVSVKKPLASTLNVGLDFLLTEDQPAMVSSQSVLLIKKDSPQPSSAQSSGCPTQITSSASSTGNATPEHPNSNFSGHRLMKRSYSPGSSGSVLSDSNDQSGVSTVVERDDEQALKLQIKSSHSPDDTTADSTNGLLGQSHVNDSNTDRKAINGDSTVSLSSEIAASAKRMKLESPVDEVKLEAIIRTPVDDRDNFMSYSESSSQSENKFEPLKDDNCFEERSPDSKISVSNSTTVCLSTKNCYSISDFNDTCKEKFDGRNNTNSLKGNLPLVPSELDEERACPEVVHSISSKVDRLDLFLDESYVCFVEHFPCT